MTEETKTEAQGSKDPGAAPEREPRTEGQAGSDERGEQGYAGADKGEGRDQRARRGPGRGRAKVSYLTINKIDYVDYKDVPMLKRFLTERGKMLPRRQTGNTAKQQRMISRSIKRAREMALLPFVVTTPIDSGPGPGIGRRPRRERPDETQASATEKPDRAAE